MRMVHVKRKKSISIMTRKKCLIIELCLDIRFLKVPIVECKQHIYLYLMLAIYQEMYTNCRFLVGLRFKRLLISLFLRYILNKKTVWGIMTCDLATSSQKNQLCMSSAAKRNVSHEIMTI